MIDAVNRLYSSKIINGNNYSNKLNIILILIEIVYFLIIKEVMLGALYLYNNYFLIKNIKTDFSYLIILYLVILFNANQYEKNFITNLFLMLCIQILHHFWSSYNLLLKMSIITIIFLLTVH